MNVSTEVDGRLKFHTGRKHQFEKNPDLSGSNIMAKLFLPLLLLTFCTQKSSVDTIISTHKARLGDFTGIQNITTVASCEGIEGRYTTRTASSFTSDYLLFQQEYFYKDNPFYAVIYSKDKGYGLDTSLAAQGELSKAVIGVLKAHEFHELAMQVDDRYFQLEQAKDTLFFDAKCHQITAVDHLDYPVRLFFNVHSGLMEGFSQTNPYQKGEVIRVHFENWEETGNLLLFKKIAIRQGKDQRYLFEYQDIVLNDPDFKKLEVR